MGDIKGDTWSLDYISCEWSSKLPCYNRDPKRDHNFDNHPCEQPKDGGADTTASPLNLKKSEAYGGRGGSQN